MTLAAPCEPLSPWLFCLWHLCWWWWERWESWSDVLVSEAPYPPTAHGQAWHQGETWEAEIEKKNKIKKDKFSIIPVCYQSSWQKWMSAASDLNVSSAQEQRTHSSWQTLIHCVSGLFKVWLPSSTTDNLLPEHTCDRYHQIHVNSTAEGFKSVRHFREKLGKSIGPVHSR